MKFHQGSNNSGCKEHCPICKDYYHPSITENAVFVDDFGTPICWECVAVHAPQFLPDDIKSVTYRLP